MHINIPETVWFPPARLRGRLYGSDLSHIGYVYPALWPKEVEAPNTNGTTYFRERRRKTFSDVVHSKMMGSSAHSLPGIKTGVYKITGTEVYNMHYCTCSLSSAPGQTSGIFCILSNGQQAVVVFLNAYDRDKATVYFEVWGDCWVASNHKVYGRYLRSETVMKRYRPKDSPWYWDITSMKGAFSQEIHVLVAQIVESCTPDVPFDAKTKAACGNNLANNLADAVSHLTSDAKRRGAQSLLHDATPLGLGMQDMPSFLLHEPGVIMDGVDDLLYGRGTEQYFRNVLIQNAYVDAVRNVPRLNDNSISTVLELTSFITNLVVHHRIDIPKNLSDAWLQYRYAYSTGKMDADEAIRFMKRQTSLGKWKSIKARGTYTINYNGVSITCRCTMRVTNRVLSKVGKVWKALCTYGLTPSFYVIWDMIPYSFIVDWFLPIGNVASALDAERSVLKYYDVSDIIFSLSYKQTDKFGCPHKFYTRWLSSTPPQLHGYYFLESDPTTKTVVKRIIDSGALILG